VLDSTGEEAAEPRALLKTLYAFRGFDPLSFERSKPKDRAELLRNLVGLDFTELEEKRKSIYTQRTVINTEGKNKKAQLDSIEVPDGTPDESMSVAELFSRLEDAQVTNREIANAKLNTSQELESAKAGAEKLAEEETRLRERLTEVERLRKESEASIPGLEKAAAEAEKMEPIDETEIREQIDSVDQVNRAVEAKKRKAELEEIVKDLRGKSQKMTDEIKSIDQEKQDRLENAKWPLPNLSLDDSGVLLNDLPFEQASKAERVVASVKVGMALNPKLRLLVCEDGNDLDNDTMAALDNVLKENDFQMLLEYVTRSEEDEAQCAVVFHDGELKSATVAHQDDEESGDLFDDK
jgi:myosin heavy subunit